MRREEYAIGAYSHQHMLSWSNGEAMAALHTSWGNRYRDKGNMPAARKAWDAAAMTETHLGSLMNAKPRKTGTVQAGGVHPKNLSSKGGVN